MILNILFIFIFSTSSGQEEIRIEDDSKIFSKSSSHIHKLNPYKERRNEIGQMFSFDYSTFTPVNHIAPESLLSFEQQYGPAMVPLVSFAFSLKWNHMLGSLSLDLGPGFYWNRLINQSDIVVSDIKIFPLTFGMTVALDNILKEPYVVPYFSFGGKTFSYIETTGLSPDQISSDPANQSLTEQHNILTYGKVVHIFLSAGFWIQLDWLDLDGDMSSYFDLGMENTYLAFGVTRVLNGYDVGANFSGTTYISLGLKFEL